MLDASERMYQPADYSTMQRSGILLVILALGFSNYANKLRKVRTGE
jgi:hypothetical protein